MLPSRAKGSGPDPLSRRRSASSTDLQRDSDALSGDIQTFAVPCFNQSVLKRQTAGPQALYLYFSSLNLQLTLFHENMPHSSLYNFNFPPSVIFSIKQATQLVTTFTVTCSDSPMSACPASAMYRHHIVEMGPAEMGPGELPQQRSSAPQPWDQLHDPSWFPMAKVLQELLSSGSDGLLHTNYHPP